MKHLGLLFGSRGTARPGVPAVPIGLALACLSCSAAADDPLGWGEPVEAREVRQYSRASLDATPRWTVAEAPTFVFVPDSVETAVHSSTGEVVATMRHQRRTAGAAFLPDGRVALMYSPAPPQWTLLHFRSLGSDTETFVPAPTGPDGRRLRWTGSAMAPHGGGVVILADNQALQDEPSGADVWHADETDGVAHSPARVATNGMLLGALRDGSLVFAGDSEETDSLFVRRILAVRPSQAGAQPSPSNGAETVFTVAYRRDPDDPDRPKFGAHRPAFSAAAAGNRIWIVPAERPELWAVGRSGDVEMKIEWDAGDRSVPPGAPGRWSQVQRFPSAAQIRIGSDGLVYVQRWTVPADRPVRGPEWLVFSPEGELLARLRVPMRWQGVLAFGDAALVAVGEGEATGLREVRAYEIRKPG